MKKQYLSLLIGFLASANACAIDIPSYSYVEASHISMELADTVEGKGAGVKASYELSDYAFIEGSFASTSGDLFDEETERDTNIVNFGIGVKQDNADGLSWFGSYTYSIWEMEESYTREKALAFDRKVVISEKETINSYGNTLRAGFRAQFSQMVQLNASISIGEFEDESSLRKGYQIGVVVELAERFYLVADRDVIRSDLDIDKTSIGVRYRF